MSTDYRGLPDERFYPAVVDVTLRDGRATGRITKLVRNDRVDLNTLSAQQLSAYASGVTYFAESATDADLNEHLREIVHNPNATWFWPEREATCE